MEGTAAEALRESLPHYFNNGIGGNTMQQRSNAKPLSALLLALICLMALPAFAMDHSKIITGPFKDATDVTKKCLTCHDDEALDLMKTPHWTWERLQKVDGREIAAGKKKGFNNFCTSTETNRVHCSECHISYGWADETFDFTDKTKIDCLACHDTTGTYHKDGDNSGWPTEHVDILAVAKSVGEPSRVTCGACHFDGGGGDGVKHGDLDSSLEFPDRHIDVHMSPDGNDFQCQACHVTEKHLVKGAAMVSSPDGFNAIGCEQCHDAAPHKESRLNKHAATVACQTCHIPYFAKELPTQMDWDWSTAGQDTPPGNVDGKTVKYKKTVGTQTWATNVVPTYAWFNGKSEVYMRGDKMDPTQPTRMSYPEGSIKDKTAKIHPFKVHTGKQVYDTKNNYFITNHIYGPNGFWSTFDWQRSIKIGMDGTGLAYSGSYGFAPTTMYWRIDHMVSPKEDALSCLDCHGDNGRMDWKALGYKGDPMSNPKWARNK